MSCDWRFLLNFLSLSRYAWEQRKLAEISSVRTGPFGSVLHASDYVQDGVPIITTEHFKNGSLPLIKDGMPQVSKMDYLIALLFSLFN